jgi:hypothetical protein
MSQMLVKGRQQQARDLTSAFRFLSRGLSNLIYRFNSCRYWHPEISQHKINEVGAGAKHFSLPSHYMP